MGRDSVIGKWFRRGLVASVLLALAGAVAGGLYGVRVYHRVEARFAGQRWQLPSTVYSDVTLLYPGMGIDRSGFQDLLRRLEYRTVDRPPSRSGEMRLRKDRIEIFLNPLRTPERERPGFPAVLAVDGGRLSGIRRLDTGEDIALLEIEPEVVDLFFGPEREKRRLVAIDEVPPHLVQAVLAAEDNRFYDHHGFDPRAVLRAALTNLRHGEIRQGGSTITQQVAKNYFLTPERTFTRKLRELLIALVLELRYDKPAILEIYLNEIYLGQNGSISINGVGEASRFYFGKTVGALTLDEAATIAAMIRGPNAYSPYRHPERCLQRRRHLLDRMRADGVVSEAQWKDAVEAPLSPVGYELFAKRAPYFVDYLSRQLAELYSEEDLASLGLSIYTTLDPQVQAAAESALERGLARLETSVPALEPKGGPPLQGAVVALEPRTGAVLAMVGGRRYSESQFNRITQARRQAGSTFKPFAFLAALDRMTPVTLLPNTEVTYDLDGTPWQPKNFSPTHRRAYRLREALALSVNRPTVHLAMETGIDRIVQTAGRFGFSTPLPPYPSLALGAVDLIPIELAGAYGVFAADGVRAHPLTIRDVMGASGEILERRTIEVEQVITPAEAYLMTSLLQSVVEEGTASGLRRMGIGVPVAGKTGTTNDYRDAWFIGYTPELLVLVWVGHDDGRSINASGAAAALPIWADLARSVPHRLGGMDFVEPPGIERREVCMEDTEEASPWPCQQIREEVFLAGRGPGSPGTLPGVGTRLQRFFKGLIDGIGR